MQSDHPENCDVMYEIMFNGITLPLVSITQVSQRMLVNGGFPFCRSTMVSVAPHIHAHDVIRNLTKATTYLAIPSEHSIIIQTFLLCAFVIMTLDFSGPSNVRSIPRFISNIDKFTTLQVEVNWDTLPYGVRSC